VSTPAKTDLFRLLPSVDDVLRSPQLMEHLVDYGNGAAADAARAVLARLREEITANRMDPETVTLAVANIGEAVERELRSRFRASLRRVINATGVILHTNLGRAPLSTAAIDHIAKTAGAYTNLEFDLASGDRGKRDVHAQRLFARLLSQSAAHPTQTVVVNNCAAAVLLALNTLAEGGEVIVSRGELV
jgi:L-seryl-tRNA(Ser) seleniumtransferase